MALVFAVACGGELPLDGRPCPCAEGWLCCETVNQCVRSAAQCSPGQPPHESPELRLLLGVPGGTGTADGVGRDARFMGPKAIVGNDDFLYVTDGYGALRRISLATAEVTTLVKNGVGDNLVLDETGLYSTWGGLLRIDTQSGAITPIDLALGSGYLDSLAGDGAGSLYFTRKEGIGKALQKLDLKTQSLTTLAASEGWHGEANVHAPFETLGALSYLDGVLYAVDYKFAYLDQYDLWAQTVWRYDLETGILTEEFLGNSTPEKISISSLLLSAHQALVSGVRPLLAVTGHCIARVGKYGLLACEWGSLKWPGHSDFVGSDGKQARFNYPSSLWSADGTANSLFVTDTGNAVIRRVQYSTVETFAGEVSHGGGSTPVAPYMELAAPTALAADALGNIVFAHHGTGGLLRIEPTGKVSSLGMRDYREPALTMDANAAVYVGDVGGSIARIDLEGGSSSTLVDLPGSTYALAHDGSRTLYASLGPQFDPWGSSPTCDLWKVDAVNGAAELFIDGSCPDALAMAGAGRLLALSTTGEPRGELTAIDLTTGKSSLLPAPEEGWPASLYGQGGALAYDPFKGLVYVAEAERSTVRALRLHTGEIFDVVGKLDSQGVQLGPLPASLNYPSAIALLPDGALAIADYNENVILVAR
jgi:hypothetical protein